MGMSPPAALRAWDMIIALRWRRGGVRGGKKGRICIGVLKAPGELQGGTKILRFVPSIARTPYPKKAISVFGVRPRIQFHFAVRRM